MTWKHFLLFILCLCHILTNGWTIERDKKNECMKNDWRNVNSKQSLMKLPIIEFRAAATESQATIDKLSIFQDFHRLNRFYSSRNVPSIVNKKSTIDEKKITGPPAKMAEIGHYDNFQSLDCRLVYKSIGLWPVVEMWQRHVYTNYMLWYFVIICSTDHIIPVFVNAIEDEDNNGSVISITLKGANKVPLPMP